MQIWKCTIHNLEFGVESAHRGANECPQCAQEKIAKLTARCEELTCHRDILLRAIEIKQTVEPVSAQ